MKSNMRLFLVLLGELALIEFLFMISRICFFVYNGEFFPEISFNRFGEICLLALRFDLAVIVLINTPFIFLALFPSPIRFNNVYIAILRGVYYCVNAMALLIDVVDCVYYRFTLERTSISVIDQFKNENNWSELIFSFLIDYWYFIAFWILLIAALVLISKKIESQLSKPNNAQLYSIVNIGLLPFIIYGIILISRGSLSSNNDPLSVNSAVDVANKPKEVSLIVNTSFSVIYPKEINNELVFFFPTDSELKDSFDPVHHHHDSSSFNPKNVVVIILESFSKEYVGFFNKDLEDGSYRGYTPFLDSLINKSKSFQYSIANGRKSIEAMPSILCSIPSLGIPYVISTYADNKVNSLSSLLKNKKYSTSFFHGGSNGSMGFQKFAFVCGFDHYFGRKEYNNDKDYDGTWGIWDDKFLQFTAQQISSFSEPFFTTIFTVTSHYPYKIPLEYKKRFQRVGEDVYQSVAYSDYSLKLFFRSLSKLPSFKNTLFVVTADHASSVIKNSEYANPTGYFEIPILFYMPGQDVSDCSVKTIQQIDIMPTILNYLHYDEPYVAFGNDAFDASIDGLSVNYLDNVYHAYYQNYLLQFDGKKAIGLFLFHEDKTLKNNLVKTRTDIVNIIEPKLKGFIQQYKNRMVNDSLYVSR